MPRRGYTPRDQYLTGVRTYSARNARNTRSLCSPQREVEHEILVVQDNRLPRVQANPAGQVSADERVLKGGSRRSPRRASRGVNLTILSA